ncbi:hypothetical protein JTE90_022159 [Oedothorax gibbosus]|uniref:Phosphatidylinositol-specific phospholipase C X domain-containing protein n=1 Tax=Oedothorax gibbosus TaxID=931172 RepID=A0AAV6VSS7_9ARAC|nr:hypothetical protein JTE90_022159 [Oedothorax gibbosus]
MASHNFCCSLVKRVQISAFDIHLIVIDIRYNMLRFYFVASVLLVITVTLKSSSSLPLVNTEKDCFTENSEAVRVFITISSLYVSTTDEGVVKRQLELNWLGGQCQPGDKINVYSTDPTDTPTPKPLLSIDPLHHPGGYFKTDIELPVRFFNLSTLIEHHCLGYWAAYVKKHDKEILSASCLRIRPFWMSESERYISNLQLGEVMIPGSHDSGSFDFHREIAPVSKYKYAQEEPIFNQLVYGLRYFDLRVGYYKNSADKYYINHNFLRTEHSVKSVLNQVLKFIKATKEIVILDFHNFPIGFKNKLVHFKLIRMITKTFGSYLIPHNHKYKTATFKDFWEDDKRILVSYDSTIREIAPNLLWPSIPRAWGNKQHPEDLKAYFKQVFQKPTPEGLWASMAELTPNTKTIVLHPETGLRIFADQINRNVTHWFRDFYWQKANIVATDYFLGNDIIDVAVQTNKYKGICPQSVWSQFVQNDDDDEISNFI